VPAKCLQHSSTGKGGGVTFLAWIMICCKLNIFFFPCTGLKCGAGKKEICILFISYLKEKQSYITLQLYIISPSPFLPAKKASQ
jgi:hypothetical protein